MSFLHNLYAKVTLDGGSKRKHSLVNSNDKPESPVYEELDGEDGFVVYSQFTDETSTAPRQTYGVQERLDYDTLQKNSIPGNYNPASGFPPSCSSKTTLTSRGVKEDQSTTFLTVSDIPLKLSKPLEIIHNSTKNLSQKSPRPINIGDYLYDFGLERTVLNSNEGNTREKRW